MYPLNSKTPLQCSTGSNFFMGSVPCMFAFSISSPLLHIGHPFYLAERKTKYQQCSGAVINALANISAHINPDPDLQMDFLLRLMEMYVTIGLEVKRNLQADREPANRFEAVHT